MIKYKKIPRYYFSKIKDNKLRKIVNIKQKFSTNHYQYFISINFDSTKIGEANGNL